MVPKSFQLSCLYSTCYTPKAVGPLYVVLGMWVTLIKSILEANTEYLGIKPLTVLTDARLPWRNTFKFEGY